MRCGFRREGLSQPVFIGLTWITRMPIRRKTAFRDPENLFPALTEISIARPGANDPRRRVVPFGVREQKAIHALIVRAGHGATFEARVASIEQGARAMWEGAGLPPYEWDRMYPLPDGGQGTPDALVAGRLYSPKWYACEILDAIGFARAVLASDDKEPIAMSAFEAGRIVAQAAARLTWASDVRVGREGATWRKSRR